MTIREFTRKVFAGQWPILLVGLIFMAAFVLVVAGYWRRGALVMAIGVGVAAVLRLALTEDRAGLLAVRSRGIDFVDDGDRQRGHALHRLDHRPVGHQLAVCGRQAERFGGGRQCREVLVD